MTPPTVAPGLIRYSLPTAMPGLADPPYRRAGLDPACPPNRQAEAGPRIPPTVAPGLIRRPVSFFHDQHKPLGSAVRRNAKKMDRNDEQATGVGQLLPPIPARLLGAMGETVAFVAKSGRRTWYSGQMEILSLLLPMYLAETS